jgi:hypothetical protein
LRQYSLFIEGEKKEGGKRRREGEGEGEKEGVYLYYNAIQHNIITAL